MQVINRTLIVKSTPEFFYKEKYGYKNNTIQEVPEDEQDMFKDFMIRFLNEEQLSIKIKCTEYKGTLPECGFFNREVTDISQFKDNIYIISFK